MSSFVRHTATALAILVGIAGVALVLYAWQLPPFHGTVETTENAYVKGQLTIVAPQLAGYIADVPVKDYDKVSKGDVLVRIDDRIYRQKVKQAEATLHSNKAQVAALEQKRMSGRARLNAAKAGVEGAATTLKTAQANFDRNQSLAQRGIVATSSFEQAASTLEQARASLAQAQANVEVAEQDLASIEVSRQSHEAAVDGAEAALQLAEIDLSNTTIVAPADGRLGEVGARVGAYVTAGTQLMAVVPEKIWVAANFKETQLAGMKVGQKVTFTVDALNHERFTGRIESFSPAAGSEFSVLKADNATGNFTKIAQRLPVRIAIDPGQTVAERLAPGMSVIVQIDTAAKG
ncbi:HlyD family secretion protein [Rhizobium sp. KVB221]|uniref:HlyD family secretion protein n=1 Tax=Rhizobium setariae TaxID=2801340 RepID=A0A936YIM0_9HYPH|nr:HlyD family secretion protein [Rhizobium setariae]MBL0370964.1 HlyD family secretion protein [Rhizobium setariae]